MITKYLRGEYGLSKSFWLIAIPFTVCLNVAFAFIRLEPGAPSTIIILLATAVSVYLIITGVYNSTKNYKGKKIWAYLSIIWCLLPLLLFIAPVIFGVTVSISRFAFNSGGESIQKTKESLRVAVYPRMDLDNCQGEYHNKPLIIMEYIPDLSNKKVFVKSERLADNKKGLDELQNCTVMDNNNWSCGGETISTNPLMISPKTSVIDGKFKFEAAKSKNYFFCENKYEVLN